jgi:LPXTG-site transpeptidase (sortase) family protein
MRAAQPFGGRSGKGGCRVAASLILQLAGMACITLCLLSGFVIWQATQSGMSLTDLIPQIGRNVRLPESPKAPGVYRATPLPSPSRVGESAREREVGPTSPPPSEGAPAGTAPPPAAEPAQAAGPPPGTLNVAGGESGTQAQAPPSGLPANKPERPATRLVIPALNVDAPAVVIPFRDGTWDVSQLTYEVGHLQGTASPGDPSNVALAGHITLSQGGYGPFRYLAQLKIGDEAAVYVGDEAYRYIIDYVHIVAPDDVEVTLPTTTPILTLITCANWDSVRRRYNDRIVAIGHLAQ